jgi:MOSC domain-containing protein YiiM
MSTVRIRELFISPGHNFFGHHGTAPGDHPTVAVNEIECLAGRGLAGDRFLDYKSDYKGQITLFSWEHLHALWDELELPPEQRHPGATRRNVIVEGLDLAALIGREFELQGVRFAGAEECRPCYWMNHAVHPDAEVWLRHRGGLRARILTDGVLRRDFDPDA